MEFLKPERKRGLRWAAAVGAALVVAFLGAAPAVLGMPDGQGQTERPYQATDTATSTSATITVTTTATNTNTPEPEPVEPAYFRIGFQGEPPTVTFVVQLTASDAISEARSILESGDNRSVMGIIVKEPAPYNPGWSYHLDPDTISFFDFATEVCDANPRYVEEHLDEACGSFLPSCRWCPWSSYVLEEIEPDQRTPTATGTITASPTFSGTVTMSPSESPTVTATGSASATWTAQPTGSVTTTMTPDVTTTPDTGFRILAPLVLNQAPVRSVGN